MHRANRLARRACWCLLLALGVSLNASTALAQPAASEVMVPVGTTGSIPTAAGAMTKTVEVVPPIVQAKLSFDGKSVEVTGLAPGFAQVRLLDAMNNVLQVINVQVIPPDLEVPFGETKVFQASPGTTIQDVRVTTPDIVKFAITMDKKEVHLTGAGLGTTKVTIIDSKGGFQVFNIAVVVSEKYLAFKIRQAVPTANVQPVLINKGVFQLNGTVEKMEDIPAVLAVADSLVGKIINSLRVAGVQQVQLDVVIASVSRNELRNMAFRWFFNDGSTFVASLLAPGQLQASGTGSATSAAVQATSNIIFGVNDGNFFGFLDALRNEGLAKFLACPKLVTMSGKPAQFLSGGRLAVPEPSGLGTNAVRFENFGTQLNFLPIVLGNGKILLEVEPIVNIVNQANGTVIAGTAVPGFDTQQLHATVELEAGQTFAIGGLIQTTINATTIKVPLLGDLPFVGAAFRSVSHNHTEQELLILVTPHLVDAMACNQLPKYVPGQETRIPDDFELFLEGILEAPRGQREIFPGNRYQAAYLNGPSASVYPCGVNGSGYGHGCGIGHGRFGAGHCGTGSCNTGSCNTGVQPAFVPTQPPPVSAPVKSSSLPTSYYEETRYHGGEAGQDVGGSYGPGMAIPHSPQASFGPVGAYGNE